MSTNKIFFLSIFMLMLSACAKDTFITNTGNMPDDDKIKLVEKGMSEQDVRYILGSPSSVVSLDRNTWIYMSSDIEQIAFLRPKETERNLLVIKFDNQGNVADIKHIDKTNGKNIKISEQKTAIEQQEQGFFRKYFGGVGTFSPIAPNNNNNNM